MASTPGTRRTFAPVTMGHIRSHGCRELLVSCSSIFRHGCPMASSCLTFREPVAVKPWALAYSSD